MAKTVAMAARARDVDISDPEALTLPGDVRAGRVLLDEDLLGRALDGSSADPHQGQDRKFVQPPVNCPPRRNSPRRPDAVRLSGSSAPSRNGLARGAGRFTC